MNKAIQQMRTGGRTTARRKVKRVLKSPGDERRVQDAIKRLGPKTIPGNVVASFTKTDGTEFDVTTTNFQVVANGQCFYIPGSSTREYAQTEYPVNQDDSSDNSSCEEVLDLKSLGSQLESVAINE
jgi:hypothetical protein